MSLVARGIPEQSAVRVFTSTWRVSVTVGNDEDSRFKVRAPSLPISLEISARAHVRFRSHPSLDVLHPQVPCGDGTLTVEALAREIERRYAILRFPARRDAYERPERTDDRSSTPVTLRDARGAQLFFEDRVCDVLENRARVLARCFTSGEGLGSGSGARVKSSRPAPKRKRAVSAPYARDDAAFEYVTPASSDLLANKPPFSSANAFACPVCVAPARAFAQPQQLQFHIRSHNTAKMTAAQRAKVHAAIQRMDDRRIDGAERSGGPPASGGAGARDDAERAAPKKEGRFFCPNPECEHNPEVEAGAHPFASFKLCRQHYLRRHSAERPHACPKCGRAYAVKADMQTHAKRCADASGERV